MFFLNLKEVIILLKLKYYCLKACLSPYIGLCNLQIMVFFFFFLLMRRADQYRLPPLNFHSEKTVFTFIWCNSKS